MKKLSFEAVVSENFNKKMDKLRKNWLSVGKFFEVFNNFAWFFFAKNCLIFFRIRLEFISKCLKEPVYIPSQLLPCRLLNRLRRPHLLVAPVWLSLTWGRRRAPELWPRRTSETPCSLGESQGSGEECLQRGWTAVSSFCSSFSSSPPFQPWAYKISKMSHYTFSPK